MSGFVHYKYAAAMWLFLCSSMESVVVTMHAIQARYKQIAGTKCIARNQYIGNNNLQTININNII